MTRIRMFLLMAVAALGLISFNPQPAKAEGMMVGTVVSSGPNLVVLQTQYGQQPISIFGNTFVAGGTMVATPQYLQPGTPVSVMLGVSPQAYLYGNRVYYNNNNGDRHFYRRRYRWY